MSSTCPSWRRRRISLLVLTVCVISILLVPSETLAQLVLPDTVSYFVTVRSFMAATCRATKSSSELRQLYCPNDATIIESVLQGAISGHPDFERKAGTSANFLYPFRTSAVAKYNNSFAKFGRRFPITSESDIGTVVRPFVLSTLRYDSSGVGKMQYCRGTEGEPYECDSNPVDYPSRTVMDEESFSTWYSDSSKYNKRFGYKQKLFRVDGGTKYEFDASNPAQNPGGNKLFDPISQSNLFSKAWPKSKFEADGLPLPCETPSSECTKGKFWYTTEIHTNFQYSGGEVFRFAGDDDVHVFINGRLAINLGGEHSKVVAVIDLDTYAQELNIVRNGVYAFDLFHAERQTRGSNYALSTTLAQTCNVVTLAFRNSGSSVTQGIDWKNPTADDWFVLGGPGYGYFQSGVVVLMAPGVENVVSYMFHRKQQNIGSGFALNFQFKMSGNAGHGFSVLLHDRAMGLSNFNGGTGPNLGLRNLEKSFAIVFDMCPEFIERRSCATQQIRVHYNKDQRGGMNENTNRTRTVFDPAVMQNWTDGEVHTVQVFYYAVPDWLEVYVDDSLRLVERGFSAENVIGNRNAFVGFASTSSRGASNMRVEISQVSLSTVKVNSKSSSIVEQQFPVRFAADGKTPGGISVQTRDACENLIQFGGLGKLAMGRAVPDPETKAPTSKAPTSAPSTTNGTSLRRRTQVVETYYPAIVVDNQDGTYTLQFVTALQGSYSVFLAFGETCSWNGTGYQGTGDCWTMYLPNAMSAQEYTTLAPTVFVDPKPYELPWDIIYGVGVGLGGLMFCIFCYGCCLMRSRRKWRRDKRFVKTGQLAILDTHVRLDGNPMSYKLAEMSNKLQETTQEVLKLRAVSGRYEEGIEEMKVETTKLKDEVKYLKRRQQEEEVNEISRSRRTSARDEMGMSARVGFKPEKTSLSDTLVPVDNRPIPPVFVARNDPKAQFLVSIAKRDVDYIVEMANANSLAVCGGDVFGQWYENGDALAMHCIGPGIAARMDKDAFKQSPYFVQEASNFLGQVSAFRMGSWVSTSVHGKPVSELLKQAQTVVDKYSLVLLVQLCGIKHEKMVVTITPYRFSPGQTKNIVGDLYVFEDDADMEATRRHAQLEVMRNRPAPPAPPPPRNGNGTSASPAPAPPPSRPVSGRDLVGPPPGLGVAEPLAKRRFDGNSETSPMMTAAPPPPLPPSRTPIPDSQSGVLNLTPRRLSLGGDDENPLMPVILDGNVSERPKANAGQSFRGFFNGKN